jgi:hypothetical protein
MPKIKSADNIVMHGFVDIQSDEFKEVLAVCGLLLNPSLSESGAVAVLNVLIIHCFMLQAKLNIKENEKYKEAKELLSTNKVKEFVPRSPNAWNRQQYGQKGVTIFITTSLSTVALTQAMLTFDWMSMLTYLFTIIMGLIFGIMQMKTAEDYWTDEFWQYAQKVKRDLELAKEESNKQRDDIASDTGRTDILESSDSMYSISDYSEPAMVGYTWDSVRFLGRNTSSDTNTDSTDNVYKENN